MAFIVEQFTGDRGVQIAVEDVIRPFSFGTNWQKIRVGCRFAVNGYSTVSTAPRLGVCTGNNAALSGSTVDAFWMNYFSTQLGVTYQGTPPNNYLYQSAAAFNSPTQQRVGSTTTNATNINVQPAFSANPTVLRSGWLFDITKGTVGASGITCQQWHMSAAQVVVDMSRGSFLAAMENESAPSGLTGTSVTAVTLPLRFNKDWDSMFIGWGRSTPTMCFYDMCVVRFA